jgi:hypothetical protein
MKIKLQYPVTACAEDHEGRNVHAFGILTGAFEIPEDNETNYPMAIEFRSGKVETPHRYRFEIETGQVFRCLGSSANADKTGRLAAVYDREPSIEDFYHKQSHQYETLRKMGRPIIPNLEPERSFVASRHQFGEGLIKVNKSEQQRCFDDIQSYLADYRVIKGMIWQPCREPTLKVSRGNDSWGVNIGHHDYYAKDWHTYYFAVDEFDTACEWIDTLDTELKQRPRTTTTIVVHPQYQAVTQGGLEDIRHLAQHVEQKIARASDNLADQRSEVIFAFAQLKEFLEADPSTISDDDVDTVVATIVRLCEADCDGTIVYAKPDLLRPKSAPLQQFRTAIELHIRRWNDRLIHIVTDRSALIP